MRFPVVIVKGFIGRIDKGRVVGEQVDPFALAAEQFCLEPFALALLESAS